MGGYKENYMRSFIAALIIAASLAIGAWLALNHYPLSWRL